MTTTAPTEPAVAADEAIRAAPFADRHPRLTTLTWLAGSLAIVTLGYAFVSLRNSGFFLVDDNESAIMPMFSHLGHELRGGTWPWVSERNWTVGLVAGDPQYAIFNPVSLFSYWALDPIGSLIWRTFLLVLLYVNVLAAGVFWAARSLGASRPFAMLATVTAGLNLFILYWQAAGWLTILPSLAWFMVAVAALLSALERPDRPWRAVAAGISVALMFTGGSPFVLLAYPLTALAVVAFKLRVDGFQSFRRFTLLGVAIAGGTVLGAVPWLVATGYVEYARRANGLYNRGTLTLHLESLVMSFTPSVRAMTGFWRGWRYLDQPVTYGSWLMAGAVAVVWMRRVRLGAGLFGVMVAGTALFVATLGPERIGPFRWPFRLVPYALVLLSIVIVVVIERAFGAPERHGDRRSALLVAGVVLTIVSFLLHPQLVVPFVTAAVLFVGVPFVLWCVRHGRRAVLVTAGIVSALGVWVAVVLLNPETTDLIDLGGPGAVALAQGDLAPLSGHRTLQLIQNIPEGDIQDVLANNYSLYGIDAAEVINGYTSLVPDGLGRLLCLNDNGYVCPAAPGVLFTVEPETGLRYIDLLGVSQVMVQRGPLLDQFEQLRSPEWTPAVESEWWVMYRNGTALGESPVVWTSDGAPVERSAGAAERVSLPAGGRIVLSRPLWPGTVVSIGGVEGELEPISDVFVSASFDEPVDGELRIEHQLPGRGLALVAGVLGIGLLAGVAVAAVASRRRGR